MNITIVAGARPNFMKIAPIIEAILEKKKEGFNINYRLVHTGQHYDKNLSGTFFKELNIPLPHTNLEVKSGTQAEQTAAIMIGFENTFQILLSGALKQGMTPKLWDGNVTKRIIHHLVSI